jgi:hypothetical protein
LGEHAEDCDRDGGKVIDFTEARWRYEQRVANLMKKGLTREEAETAVQNVITTKEGPHETFYQEAQ